MPRQRKGKTSSEDVPMVKPTEMSGKKGTGKPLIEISEEEQWRMINESGILKQIPKPDQQALDASLGEGGSEELTFGEEVADMLLYLIPFSFLLLMMDILIHYQYSRRPTRGDLLERMISGVPILAIFTFYTLRYKSHRRVQFVLFAISIISGCRLIYQINHSNWLINMKQCPPLATVWIFTIFMVDLGPAVLSLLTVGSFVWWKELKIIL
ncbi:hypothetical protein NP233_g2138 [Leucocoprinus birnbaumii]|uniref:DUF7719 domain-containing protein n=1 Tax=Leucocoprinus birnbaumii TaxID=56174 RepID=A0AAD5VYT0_9AGAR|nr:hypothetical protein NP233_g2138 [Leucocoprinus birnbaumii]